jgi:hypothetical protein
VPFNAAERFVLSTRSRQRPKYSEEISSDIKRHFARRVSPEQLRHTGVILCWGLTLKYSFQRLFWSVFSGWSPSDPACLSADAAAYGGGTVLKLERSMTLRTFSVAAYARA